VNNGETTLFLATQHPDARLRLVAIQQLLDGAAGSDADADPEFVKEVLVERLRVDDDAKVVQAVLAHPALATVVPAAELARLLVDRLRSAALSTTLRRRLLVVLAGLLRRNEALDAKLRLEVEATLLRALVATPETHRTVKQVCAELGTARKPSGTAGRLDRVGAAAAAAAATKGDDSSAAALLRTNEAVLAALVDGLLATAADRAAWTAQWTAYLDDLAAAPSFTKTSTANDAAAVVATVLPLAAAWARHAQASKPLADADAALAARWLLDLQRHWVALTAVLGELDHAALGQELAAVWAWCRAPAGVPPFAWARVAEAPAVAAAAAVLAGWCALLATAPCAPTDAPVAAAADGKDGAAPATPAWLPRTTKAAFAFVVQASLGSLALQVLLQSFVRDTLGKTAVPFFVAHVGGAGTHARVRHDMFLWLVLTWTMPYSGFRCTLAGRHPGASADRGARPAQALDGRPGRRRRRAAGDPAGACSRGERPRGRPPRRRGVPR